MFQVGDLVKYTCDPSNGKGWYFAVIENIYIVNPGMKKELIGYEIYSYESYSKFTVYDNQIKRLDKISKFLFFKKFICVLEPLVCECKIALHRIPLRR